MAGKPDREIENDSEKRLLDLTKYLHEFFGKIDSRFVLMVYTKDGDRTILTDAKCQKEVMAQLIEVTSDLNRDNTETIRPKSRPDEVIH